MNKKIISICLMLATFAGSAFAQTDFSASAKSRATAGEYTSDSDNLSAKDIFDIDRTFFSAGYMPALSGAGNYAGTGDLDSTIGKSASTGTMSAFWAMPINEMMTVGFAGEYNMSSYKEETVGIGSGTLGTVNNGIFSTTTSTEDSKFNLRPVFKFGNMAFHYRIYRNYTGTTARNTVTEDGSTLGSDSQNLYNSTVTSGNSEWEHEIGFAMDMDAFKIYVPVGVAMEFNREITKSSNAISSSSTTIVDSTEYDSSNEGADVIAMYINPQFIMALEMGPMYQITFGIDAKFDIVNTGKGSESYTEVQYAEDDDFSAYTTKTTIIEDYEGAAGMEFGLYVNPSFEWKAWEEKVSFAVDPTFGVKYAYTNAGTLKTTTTYEDSRTGTTENPDMPGSSTMYTTYDNYITPYLDVYVGSTVRPLEWLELRAGISYGLAWQNQITTDNYSDVGGKTVNEANYTFASAFNVYGGFGFIFGEDFFIDVYAQMGQSDDSMDLALGNTASGGTMFIQNTAFGAQLSYRF